MRNKIVDIAQSQVGTVEGPNNDTKYGKWYGMNNVAWCAIFVSWVYNEAGSPLGKVDSPKGFHYCPSAFNFWRKNGKVLDKKKGQLPQPGDIVLFDWQGDKKSDHTGIFVEWAADGKFVCIEGNTSPDHRGSQSNGGGVYKRIREEKHVLAFVSVL